MGKRKERAAFALPCAVLNGVVSAVTAFTVMSLFMGKSIFSSAVSVPLVVCFTAGVGVGVGGIVVAVAMQMSKERFPWNALCFSVFVVSVSTGIGFTLV